MKRFLFAAALLLSSVSGYAQLVQSSSLIVTKKALDPVARGYQSDVRIGVMSLGYHGQTTIEATYAGGYRFGNTLYIGAGVGVNYNTWSGQYVEPEHYGKHKQFGIPSAKITVPLFAQIRVYFLKSRISPFVDATGGVMLTSGGEVGYGYRGYYEGSEYRDEYEKTAKYGRSMGYGTLSLGVNYRMTDKSSVYLLVGGRLYGARVMQADEEFYHDVSPLPSSLNIGTRTSGGFYAAIGFTF